MSTSSSAIAEIARWDPDAAREDVQRYFFQTRIIKEVVSGKKNLVIGRKGSGKTAIFEFIRAQERFDRIVIPFNFSDYQFSLLYRFSDGRSHGAARFTALWKYVIYSHICGIIAHDPQFEVGVASRLRSKLPHFTDAKIAAFIPSVRKDLFRLKIPEILELESEEKPVAETIDWQKAVETLEEIICSYDGPISFTVLFDALDDDYHNIVAQIGQDGLDFRRDYFDLVIGLIKAVYYISSLPPNRTRYLIQPIVFISEDIFRLIGDRDKTKWMTISSKLVWGKADIQDFLSYRISRSIEGLNTTLPFNAAWSTVFQAEDINVGRSKKQMPIFDYILNRTLHRPRDFVRYLQMVAAHVDAWGYGIIRPGVVVNTEGQYSEAFLSEFKDEMCTMLPDIDFYFDIISRIRLKTFPFDEFERRYEELKADQILKSSSAYPSRLVLNEMYEHSVLGNWDEDKKYRTFRFSSPNAAFDYEKPIIVHSGLFRALGISRPKRSARAEMRPQTNFVRTRSQLDFVEIAPDFELKYFPDAGDGGDAVEDDYEKDAGA